MKIVEFLLKFNTKDTASGVLSKLTHQVDDLNTRAANANKNVSSLASRIGGSLKDAVMSLPGAGFFTNPIIATGLGIAKVVQLGTDAEKTATSFNVLLGSESAATDMLKKIGDYAARTPLSKLDLQENAKTMLSFGISSDKAFSSLQMLGDVSGGDAQKLNSLSLAFSQATAAGKLQGQDLLQMINAGWNPLNDIAQMTGKSIGQVKDAMSKGAISSDVLYDALKHATAEGGQFHGMLDKLSTTTGGRLSTLADHFTTALTNIFTIIQPVVDFLISSLDTIIEKGLAPLITYLNAVFQSVSKLSSPMNNFGEYVNIAGTFFREKVLPVVISVGNCIGKIVSDVVKWISKSQLVKDVVALTFELFGNVFDMIKNIVGVLDWVWTNVAMPLLDAIEKVYVTVKNLLGLGGKTVTVKTITKSATAASDIKVPALNGSPSNGNYKLGEGDGGGKTTKNKAENVTTGGTRNTSVYVNITKLIETMNTYMGGNNDEGNFEDRVIECMVRAINMGVSSAK